MGLFFGTDEVSLSTLKAMYSLPNLVSDISVVCAPDHRKPCEVKKFAQHKDISVYQPTKEDLKTFQIPKTKNGEDFDIAVVVSYGNMIPKHIISTLPFKSLNMHPSFLPFYRGPAPLIRQLENGERVGGISIIELSTEKFDIGRTFLQWAFKIPDDITSPVFTEYASHHGAHAIIEVLENYGKYLKKISPQKE